ncbi:hypothetical protein BJY04DRAFT_180326 [Aspergillus karnatakaensis]|uniref:putative C6 transcription factor n=1 Tax=Aspergillus karnatakaensis TaxID=1810916 RepID=UPI003CCD5E0C
MSSPVQKIRATRSSLACLPCRSRHLKCDGKKPCCSRCAEAAQDCHYARSRRGGVSRAALAERRKQFASLQNATNPTVVDDWTFQTTAGVEDEMGMPSQFVEGFNGGGVDAGSGSGNATTSINSPASTVSFHLHMTSIEKDVLIESYYNNFYDFHPFVLPRRHMIRHYHDGGQQSLQPLIAAMRLVGYLYQFHEWSSSLQEQVENSFSQASPSDPMVIQARLLYSIALFWYDHKNEAKAEIDAAIHLAQDMRLYQEEFALEHGGSDLVLQENWRRTWWMLYIVDCYYAGTLGTMEMRVVEVEATVGLPCEEQEYESGDIPTPKTLQDFDTREFSPDDIPFSSFAYLIGAVRCAALAIATVPRYASKEDSTHVIQAADSALDGWLLLLPKDRKQVLSKAGEIDELMYQAHCIIHVSTIGIHRPLSDLKFNPIEDISSCARPPPPDTPVPDLVNVHTTRVLRSIEAQIRLLTLPAHPFRHTPFTTCMVSEGTLALLSACHFFFRGEGMSGRLAIARDQIRVTIGCLKVLGEVWPRTRRNVREIQTIAQCVLGVGPVSRSRGASENGKGGASGTPGLGDLPRLEGGVAGASSLRSGLGFGSASGSGSGSGSESGGDILSLLGSFDDLCGWYNIGDLGGVGGSGGDISWDMAAGVGNGL